MLGTNDSVILMLVVLCTVSVGAFGSTVHTRNLLASRVVRAKTRTLAAAAAACMLDDGESTELQQHVDLLNSCFNANVHATSDDPPPATDLPTVEATTPAAKPAGAHLFPALPIWRVQWVTLPHHNELLNVHVPHYCHMFTEIMSRERPWLFGSLFLEGGSRNLGAEGFETQPGDVGTLCEIVTCERQSDGRLLLGTRAVGRIEVQGETQTLPYTRADCEFYADVETLELVDDAATEAVAALASDEASLPRITNAVRSAALAAASTLATGWAALEATLPVDPAEGIPALSSIDVESAHELKQASARISASAIRAADDAASSALSGAAMGAGAAPTEPSPLVYDEEELAELPAWEDLWRDWHEADEEQPLACVEACCWNELLATWTLAGRLRPTLKLGDLPPMLTSLMPPPPPGGWDECPTDVDDGGVCLNPGLTLPGPVRRARASYLLTALLPELVKTVEQRLELLRSRSVRSRLLVLCQELEKQRKVLAAVLALQSAVGPADATGDRPGAIDADGGDRSAEMELDDDGDGTKQRGP